QKTYRYGNPKQPKINRYSVIELLNPYSKDGWVRFHKSGQWPAEKRGPWVMALSGEEFFRLDVWLLCI
ncbi:hypothetical protein ACFQZS_00005, partial [Mucilaginibacter calamicampi]